MRPSTAKAYIVCQSGTWILNPEVPMTASAISAFDPRSGISVPVRGSRFGVKAPVLAISAAKPVNFEAIR
jgi:hypothetical protein